MGELRGLAIRGIGKTRLADEVLGGGSSRGLGVALGAMLGGRVVSPTIGHNPNHFVCVPNGGFAECRDLGPRN